MSVLEEIIRKIVKEAVIEAVEDMRTVSPAEAEVVGEDVVEPGTKRKRRTKAEIAADTAAGLQSGAPVQIPLSNATTTAAQTQTAKVEYRQVQEAVLKLVELDRKTDVMTILSQFGVATAKALKPEQWAECFNLLQAKISEEGELA